MQKETILCPAPTNNYLCTDAPSHIFVSILYLHFRGVKLPSNQLPSYLWGTLTTARR